jgi:hypothetical protein
MPTANYYGLAEAPQSYRELKEERARVATKPSSFARPKVEAEPETRLWRVCAAAASPRLSRLEWIAILVFGASAFLSLAFCAFESFHLFSTGSLDQIVRAILTR